MKVVQIATGHRGVRQLAGALADVRLRHRGLLPFEKPNHGSNRAWTDNEFDDAQAMRLAKKPNSEIASTLGRTEIAIVRMIGA